MCSGGGGVLLRGGADGERGEGEGRVNHRQTEPPATAPLNTWTAPASLTTAVSDLAVRGPPAQHLPSVVAAKPSPDPEDTAQLPAHDVPGR